MESTSVELFISYSHRDEALKHQLDKHLASLKRQQVIDSWHDRRLEAGMEWAKEIDDNLNQADIILLLISPDFIYSNYCSEIEMEQAIKRHEAGEAIVVPIILEPCDWQWLPCSKYQAFPKDAKPITTWTNINEAFLDVIQGIRTVAERLFEQRQQKFKEKEAARDRYTQKVKEILSSNGEISIPAQDTLDELREELKLNPEEAAELQISAFEPYKKYKAHLEKYGNTFLKVIQQEYPISDKTQADLKLRQRDLGIKHEDAEQIEKLILSQVTFQNKDQVKKEESQKQLEIKKLNSLPHFLEVIKENVVPIKAELTEPIEQLQRQPEALSNSIANATQLQPTSEISTTPCLIFLERCQRELALYIGPLAQFIIEDILDKYPEIMPQQLVQLLANEIPNSQNANQFKKALL